MTNDPPNLSDRFKKKRKETEEVERKRKKKPRHVTTGSLFKIPTRFLFFFLSFLIFSLVSLENETEADLNLMAEIPEIDDLFLLWTRRGPIGVRRWPAPYCFLFLNFPTPAAERDATLPHCY